MTPNKKMTNPFTTIHGKRVLIPYPTVEAPKEKKKGQIIMPDQVQKEHDKEMEEKLIKEYLRITIIAVGTECERVKPGDEIWIPARTLAPGRSDALEIDGVSYFMINENDIAATY